MLRNLSLHRTLAWYADWSPVCIHKNWAVSYTILEPIFISAMFTPDLEWDWRFDDATMPAELGQPGWSLRQI